MEKKIVRRQVETLGLFDKDCHPLLQRIYSTRGIQSQGELDRGLERLLPYQDLLGMTQAVSLLALALAKQEKFLIVGDFDADGATSTAVAVRALRSFGAKHVDYLVPNRFAFGYGLTPELVDVAKELHPAVIITVDNGIANHAGVIAAKNAGMCVIITDHHLPSDTLPPADAIVNPNQPHDTFCSKHIAGVGVIFYVMLALRRYLSDQDWFTQQEIPEPTMSRLLDIVALGTVADVVHLDHNNRILVYQGLRRIRAGHCVPGIKALLDIAGRNQSKMTAADLGFAVAPRLNAAGRLEDMSLGIECLLTDYLPKAQEIAKALNQLNEERRVIEQDMQHQAMEVLNAMQLTPSSSLPRGICLFNEEWHQGVIGILASRIKDRTQRPVIAFALANENELKGSGRSVPGFHIRDALALIAARYPHFLNKFGGHAMAAGLTIPRAFFTDFSRIFSEIVSQQLSDDTLNQKLLSDGELTEQELTLEIADVLRDAGPWGQGFPEPLFDGLFDIVDQYLVGGKHLKMILSKEGRTMHAIAFNVDLKEWPDYRCKQVKIVYRMDINEFRGKRSMQLIVEHVVKNKEELCVNY